MAEEKPILQRAKLWYTLIVVALVVGAIVALAIARGIEVTADQIISFGEWVLGFLVGGHTITDITKIIKATPASSSSDEDSDTGDPESVESKATEEKPAETKTEEKEEKKS